MSNTHGDTAPFRCAYEIVLDAIPAGDLRQRAYHAAQVQTNRIGGRMSDSCRDMVRLFEGGRLPSWAEIHRDANPGPLEAGS